MKYIVNFNEVQQGDSSSKLLGGKGASLAKLFNNRFPVPEGFVITTKAFKKFSEQDLSIQELEVELDKHSSAIGGLYAVRSSANAEDAGDRSFAGQFDSFLAVEKKDLVKNIRLCWASVYNARALQYTGAKERLEMAVVVQKFINPEFSGVCFSRNPVSNDEKELVVESVRGFGELLVSGQVTPDHYVLGVDNFKINNFVSGNQEECLVLKENRLKKITNQHKCSKKLGNKHINKIGKLASEVKAFYKYDVDIEWAICGNNIYLLQARPITSI